jgi:hypothetical protein
MTVSEAPPPIGATRPAAPVLDAPSVVRHATIRWRPALVVFALWMAFALGLAGQYTFSGAWASGVGFIERASHFVPFYAVWAVLTPLIFFVAEGASIERAGVARALALHVAAAFAISALHTTLYVPLSLLVSPGFDPWPFSWHFRGTLVRHLPGDLLTYACVVLLWTAIEYRRHTREQLTRARLDALTSQLQPHFLFNTFQAISTLIHRDPRAADQMVTRLSEFLRLTLRNDGRHLVTLGEEMELVEHYAAIMRERFGARFVFRTSVQSDAAAALVPVLLLQPLVENAVKHAVASHGGEHCVSVSAVRDGADLRLTVSDAGSCAPDETRRTPGTGLGLRNIRARLRELYGEQQLLRVERDTGGVFRVLVVIPYRGGLR